MLEEPKLGGNAKGNAKGNAQGKLWECSRNPSLEAILMAIMKGKPGFLEGSPGNRAGRDFYTSHRSFRISKNPLRQSLIGE